MSLLKLFVVAGLLFPFGSDPRTGIECGIVALSGKCNLRSLDNGA